LAIQNRNRDWWGRIKRSTRYNYLRIVRLKTSAHSIALGMAVGWYVGFLPIIPFQTIVAVALAFLCRSNKFTAALGTWISNPLTYIPFFYVLFVVGDLFVPFQGLVFDPNNLELKQMLESGWKMLVVIAVGGNILGIPSSFVVYYLTRKAVLGYRKRKALAMLQQRNAT